MQNELRHFTRIELMNTMKQKLILLFLFAIPGMLFAQDVSFSAQAPKQVSLGQRFQLTFVLNSNEGTNFIGPEIVNFDILNGPMMSSGQNIMTVNGKMVYSSSTTYSFILQASKAGTFTIPQAIISVKGKRYMSNTLTITVLNQGQGQGQGQQRPGQQNPNNNQQQGRTQVQPKDDIGNDVFLKAVVDKNNPYQGELIVATFKLYTPTNRLQVNPPNKIPSFPGFWAQDLMKDATQYPQYTEVVNGKKYMVAELRKVALYPQKSGILTIDPLVQDVIYQVKVKARNPFADDPFFGNDPFFKNFMDDSFMGSDFQNVKKTLSSAPITINVKPLPTANHPLDYTGAVGQFTMKAQVDRNQVNTNDGITLKVSVTGSGNLSLIEKPAITFPPDFEAYDPKIIDNFNNKGSTSGTRTFEYLIIPRAAGDFVIDPVQFAYFDPSRRDYIVLSSDKFKIKVNKGAGNSGESTVQGDVKFLGNDIRYLMEPPLNISPIGAKIYGKPFYWLLLILPVLGFFVFVFLYRKNMRQKGDAKLMQRKKATRIAVKRLQKAKKLLISGQHDAFHEEISFALWGYISQKFNIPMSLLSMDTAREQLEGRNVDSALTERFMSTLNDCNYARYAPVGKALNMQQLYDLAIKTITETEQVLK
ncbi:MAG: BatD family protein [Bacteroidota bacterium]